MAVQTAAELPACAVAISDEIVPTLVAEFRYLSTRCKVPVREIPRRW